MLSTAYAPVPGIARLTGACVRLIGARGWPCLYPRHRFPAEIICHAGWRLRVFAYCSSLLQGSQSADVMSFGLRLAYESPRGANPRCVRRDLSGFEELRVLRVTDVVFTRPPRTAAPAVLPAKQGSAPMLRVGQIGDDVWDRRE
jgi:hypothetical protein